MLLIEFGLNGRPQWCRYVPRRKIAEEQRSRADELQRCFDKLGDFDEDDRGRRR